MAKKRPLAPSLQDKVARFLLEELAEEVVLFEVKEGLSWTDAFVLATAQNRVHLGTLRASVKKWGKTEGLFAVPEGQSPETEWSLLDLGSVVVHLLTPAARDRWDLDALFADYPKVAYND
ncbi:ribosome silencing factor [bacterium]|nr:ribosome silencing factor [bacterium]